MAFRPASSSPRLGLLLAAGIAALFSLPAQATGWAGASGGLPGFSAQAGTGSALKGSRQALRKARMGQTAARAGMPRPDSREEQKEKIAGFTKYEDCTAYVQEQRGLTEQRAKMQGREPPPARKKDVCAHLSK